MDNGQTGRYGACVAHHVTTARGLGHVHAQHRHQLMAGNHVTAVVQIQEFAICAHVQVTGLHCSKILLEHPPPRNLFISSFSKLTISVISFY